MSALRPLLKLMVSLVFLGCGKSSDATADAAAPGDTSSETTSETGPSADSDATTYDAGAGCPAKPPHSPTPCTEAEIGKSCWYEEDCQFEIGRLNEYVCKKSTTFEDPNPIRWELARVKDCPKKDSGTD